jgi:hypothetical protein
MNGLIGHVKAITFHTKWVFMSPQERYAYLWTRTKKLGDLDYGIRDTVTRVSKIVGT